MTSVVQIEGFLGNGGVLLVVSLLEDLRCKLLLLLSISVYFGRSCIDWLSHGRFCLPVGSGAVCIALGFTIVLDLLALEVATPEDRRLQLLVLLFASINLLFVVSVHSYRFGHFCILPIRSRRQYGAIFLTIFVGSIDFG